MAVYAEAIAERSSSANFRVSSNGRRRITRWNRSSQSAYCDSVRKSVVAIAGAKLYFLTVVPGVVLISSGADGLMCP
jgi:hypothetical protein